METILDELRLLRSDVGALNLAVRSVCDATSDLNSRMSRVEARQETLEHRIDSLDDVRKAAAEAEHVHLTEMHAIRRHIALNEGALLQLKNNDDMQNGALVKIHGILAQLKSGSDRVGHTKIGVYVTLFVVVLQLIAAYLRNH